MKVYVKGINLLIVIYFNIDENVVKKIRKIENSRMIQLVEDYTHISISSKTVLDLKRPFETKSFFIFVIKIDTDVLPYRSS